MLYRRIARRRSSYQPRPLLTGRLSRDQTHIRAGRPAVTAAHCHNPPMDSDGLRPHLDVINRFYDRVVDDQPLTVREAAAVYRAGGVVQDNLEAVDSPLRPALAEITSLCKAKLKRRLNARTLPADRPQPSDGPSS